jgi:peptidoglycan/xylan/chitin deacetylase (PgdA/CDA1 family)
MVLCYHRFEERPRDLVIKPADFEEQMQALKDNGFTVIGMQDFLAWRRGEKSIPPKSCIISLDDGWRSGYEVAWPILKKFGYPFTMFIYTNYVKGQSVHAGGQSLSWDELEELRDAGVDIQCHTVSHSDLRKPPKGSAESADEWLRHELEDSKHLLEQKLGISVKALAYPYGNHNEKVRAAAMAAGYEACFTVYGQRITYHSSAAQLGRYAIDSVKPQVFQAALKMIGGGGGGDDDSRSGQLAGASMVTQPMDGETITDPQPTLKANLATLGEVDPKSVEVRLSGVGQLAAKYDPATKTVEAPVTQKLRDKNYTVILSAKVKGRKIETRWTFNFAPGGASQ